MFEYLLIDGVNDRLEDAINLAKLMKGSLYHVNLIKYHDTGGDFNPSPQAERTHFSTLLRNSAFPSLSVFLSVKTSWPPAVSWRENGWGYAMICNNILKD